MVTTRSKVLNMTELSLLTAIIFLMAFTPLGYLRTGGAEITFIVIPVAVGSVLLGAKAGAFLGFMFGLTSLIQCFGMSAFGTMLFNAKPLATIICCIVPRIFVGIVPAVVYQLISKHAKKKTAATAIGCVLAPITNTVLYLAFNVVFFQDYFTAAYGYTGRGGLFFLLWLLAFVSVNAILEAVSCLLIGTAIVKALESTVNRM